MSKIFALSDWHLSLYRDKPMDGFGGIWKDHPAKIEKNIRERVSAEDYILIAGDISWAMREEEAAADLTFIENLPGKKILIRGNHDFWWGGVARLNEKYKTMRFLQNDAVYLRELNVAVCGTRGWLSPGDAEFEKTDGKIYRREQERLKLSLNAAMKLGANEIIVMIHYPPTGFRDIIEAYLVSKVVYGHLHLPKKPVALGEKYFLTSADYLDFTPLLIPAYTPAAPCVSLS